MVDETVVWSDVSDESSAGQMACKMVAMWDALEPDLVAPMADMMADMWDVLVLNLAD